MAAGAEHIPAAASRSSRTRLISIYYDTPDRALARCGSTLRVRRRGRKFVQTVKTAVAAGASHLTRGEWEDRVANEQPDPRAARTGRFLSPDIAEHLRPLFRTEVSRVMIPLRAEPETRIEAAIDRGRIWNGDGVPPEPISEVELELKSGPATALYDVALKLLDVAPLRLEHRSKADRGYRLATRATGAFKAVHAPAIDLHAGLLGHDVLRRVGHACLDHLLRNEDAVLAGDAEGIHQMRVAVRRLRAILSAFAPLLPTEQRIWATDQLRWFGQALGDARNLDVFIDELVRTARAALPGASEFERLAVVAERRRRTAHDAVTKAISSTHYTQIALEVLRWFESDNWCSEDAQALRQPIETVAPLLLDRCYGQVDKRARNFAEQSAKKRHKLRIALKKLRYAAELLAPLYDAGATKQFTQRLKRLQDDLGDANDVRVGRDIVRDLAAPGHRSVGIAHAGHRILTWHQDRIAENEPQLRRHLAELLAAEPFWRVADGATA